MKRILLISSGAFLLLSLISLIGCSEKSMFQPVDSAPAVSEPEETVLCERVSEYPLTDYKAFQTQLRSRLVGVSAGVEDFLGRGYKTEYYPLEDARNVSWPVIDMTAYEKDYPGSAESVAINQSTATYSSFASFDRYAQKTEMSSKFTTSAGVNVLKVFSFSAEQSFSDVFSSFASSSGSLAYGESTVSYYADKYEFSLPSGLYDRILDGYLDDVFMDYLYNSTPDELFDNYGCFVLGKFISGANATAIYKAVEKGYTTVETVESNMDELMSANVKVGSLFSAGLSFGSESSSSSSDTVEHNFSETAFSIHTYGGLPSYTQFTPPKDVNDVCFDLSEWCKSIKDKKYHTIADIPDNALIPLYEFIEEDNLREGFIDIMERGYANGNEIEEPYIGISGTRVAGLESGLNLASWHFTSYLMTRYGEKLLLGEHTVYGTGDEFIASEQERLKKHFPGLKFTVLRSIDFDSNSEINNDDFIALDSTDRFPHELPCDVVEMDMDMDVMRKYVNPKTGKIYLLYDSPHGNKKIAYTVYGENVIDDYTFGDVIDGMEEVTDMDVEDIRREYRLVAL